MAPPFDPTKKIIKSKADCESSALLKGAKAVSGPVTLAAMRLAIVPVKAKFPLSYSHLCHSLDKKKDVKHDSKSKMAKAIMASKEIKAAFKKFKADACISVPVFFSSNSDLRASLQRARVSGDLTIKGKEFNFKGIVTDKYDFRWDLVPAKKDLKGYVLRYAGNAMFLAQELNLAKSYKIQVELDFKGTL